MSVKTEVTRGVFDPRTYREADPENSARKRRSDWLSIPGKIHYVRERTVASEERELKEQARKEVEQVRKDVEPKQEQPQEQMEEDVVPEVIKITQSDSTQTLDRLLYIGRTWCYSIHRKRINQLGLLSLR